MGGAHTAGVAARSGCSPSTSSLHTSCFGVNPAPATSGENRADLFQHSELQDMDSERVVILVLASLLLNFIAFSCYRVIQISKGIGVLAYFSDPGMLAFHQWGRSAGGSLLYPLLDSFGFRFCCYHSPHSPMSLLLHGSFWLLLSNSELWRWHTRLGYW